MNSIFGIKNTEFNSSFKKMIKVVRLKGNVAIAVVVDDVHWQSSMLAL